MPLALMVRHRPVGLSASQARQHITAWPGKMWVRLSLVAMCTVSRLREGAGSKRNASGAATPKFPPSDSSARTVGAGAHRPCTTP